MTGAARAGGGDMRVFGFAGWSGSGKTTLIERLIPLLTARGIAVSLVKHAHHEFDVDQPGKDSYRHRQAGAREVLVTSALRWALMHELRGNAELTLREAVGRLSPCDLVLVEGFKAARIPKLEVHRPGIGKPLLHPADAAVVALATDQPGHFSGAALPVLHLDDHDAIATLIVREARPLDGVV